MNRKKIVVIVLVVIAITLCFYIFMFSKDYGFAYNTERTKLGIPIIPKDWKTNRTYSHTTQTWFPSKTDVSPSYHSWKKIKTSFGQIEYEYDYFILDNNKAGLSMSYIYKDTAHWIINYYTLKDEVVKSSKKISYKEAMKILKSHNIDL